MRVLFTTFAARSHLFAQVTLASALRTAGHDVLVASQPDLVPAITGAGLSAVPVGGTFDLEGATQEATESFEGDRNLGGLAMSNSSRDPYPWDHALGMFSAMTAFVFQNVCPEPMIDDLVALARRWRPDLVIWDPLTMGGAVAAHLSGAAHARLLFGPDQIARNRLAFTRMLARRPAPLRDDPLAEWLGWTLERNGGSADDVGEELVLGQWTIDPMPPSMRLPLDLEYLPVRHVPYNGPAVVPDWLREPCPAPARIALTLGVSMGESPDGGAALARTMLAAVGDLDVEVVAMLPPALRDVLAAPPGVRVVDYVPLDALLPTCAAIVHHGGSGTFMTALRHGVPQLLLPDGMWDSMEKAFAVERAGAGGYLPDPAEASAAELRAAIVAVLTRPEYAAGARRVRAEVLATASPNDVVPALERLTARHRRALDHGSRVAS